MSNQIKVIILIGWIILAQFAVAQQELPITPVRTIQFNTTEGTYMNVDVSPDGKTLVFDLLGDLYTLPASGGTATQITHGLALHLRPIWSPDGRYIAYSGDNFGNYHHLQILDLKSNKDLYFKPSDQIDYIDESIWSPDASTVFSGGKEQCITDKAKRETYIPKKLLRISKDNKQWYLEDSNKLVVYIPIKKAKRIIFLHMKGDDYQLSPDFNWLTYIINKDGQHSLNAINLQNKQEKILIPEMIKGDIRYGLTIPLQHYCFSPNSKNIYISYDGKIHQIQIETGKDDTIPFFANIKADYGPLNYNTYRVVNNPFQIKYMRDISKSSNGKQLVFMALGRIYTQEISNGKPRLLTSQNINQFQPAISPNGKTIVYATWCDTAGGAIWKISAKGGCPVKVTALSGQYQHPTWSPNGRQLAVIYSKNKLGDRDDPGLGQLQLIDFNNQLVRIVDDSVRLWNNIVFSKDGKKLTYIDHIKSGDRLVTRDIATRQTLVLYHTPNNYTRPLSYQYAPSPDQKYMLYSTYEDLYLQIPRWKMPYRFAAGVDPYWDKDGRTIHWTYANHLYSVKIHKVIQKGRGQLKLEQQQGKVENQFITNWIKPDEDIKISLTVPTNYQRGTIALINATIVTMEGDLVLNNGTIVIKNGRIISVNKPAKGAIPKDAKVYDLRGKTIMPGLIDIHLHMRISPNIFPQQSWMFLANLAYGVTTARDPSLNFDSFGYVEMVRNGQMLGPRLFTVGRRIDLVGGILRMDKYGDAQSVVEKRRLLGGTEVKQYTLPSRLQKQFLAMACRKQRLNMTNEGDSSPIIQWGMLKDGSTGIEHNPIFGDTYNDEIQMYSKSGSYLTPTLQVVSGPELGSEYFNWKYWHNPNAKLLRFSYHNPKITEPTFNGAEPIEVIESTHPLDTINPPFLTLSKIDARILHAGGKITMGSHGNDEGIGAHNEIWALQMGGMTNMEALRCATLSGAEALGIQQDLGSIEPGKIADLIILNKNPLEDIHNTREIKYVMKDGILYDGDTLDELWPVYKKCPEWKMKTNLKTDEKK